MEIWRFLLCTSLLVAGCSATSFYSHLKKYAEFTLRELQAQRRSGDSGMAGDGGMAGEIGTTAAPSRFTEFKTFTFTIDEETIVLNLKLNEQQTDHVPVKVVTKNTAHRVRDDAPRDYAFYQNVDEEDATKSSVMVRCPIGEECHIVGRFEHNGETYFVEPCTHQPKKKGVRHGAHKVDVNNVVDNMEDDEVKTIDVDNNVSKKTNLLQKRTGATNHVIEVSIVVDFSIYKYWLEKLENDATLAVQTIKQYYEQVANNMDRIYSSAATATMTIDIVPLEIIIMTDAASCPWVTNNLHTVDSVEYLNVTVLDSFNAWALEQNSTFADYDSVMTFTRENIAEITTNDTGHTNVNDGVGGLALQYQDGDGEVFSAVCGDKENWISVAIVQDFDTTDVSGTAAHELAHTMGVKHDYLLGCNTVSQYVMAWFSSGHYLTSDTASNPWTFSSCSITALQTYMTKLADAKGESLCTQKNTYDETDYNRVQTGKYLGEIYTIDDQCVLINGLESVRCELIPNSEVCYKGMYCWIPGTPSCNGLYGIMIGTTIGEKKCYKGQLVDTLP